MADKRKPKSRGKPFKVWVKIGFGFAAGLFIEDVTQYEPEASASTRYLRATLYLDPPQPRPRKGKGAK